MVLKDELIVRTIPERKQRIVAEYLDEDNSSILISILNKSIIPVEMEQFEYDRDLLAQRERCILTGRVIARKHCRRRRGRIMDQIYFACRAREQG